jgi:hypothetical protein
MDSEESEYEYYEGEEEDEEAEDSAEGSPERDDDGGLFIKKKGVVPKGKDKHNSKAKEMLSFIAYPQAIETSCKLQSQNRTFMLSEEIGKAIKNRIFVSSNAVMSTKT